MRTLTAITATSLTTIVGALAALSIGCADAWFFHAFNFDQMLIGGGLSALLALNPIAPVPGTTPDTQFPTKP